MKTDHHRHGRHTHSGGGLFFLVLTLGLLISRFKVSFGIGLSFRIPGTSRNFTLAWSLGAKGKAAAALPPYTVGKVGGNQDFINSSHTVTIGPAEGIALAIVGEQEGAPPFDFHYAAVPAADL